MLDIKNESGHYRCQAVRIAKMFYSKKRPIVAFEKELDEKRRREVTEAMIVAVNKVKIPKAEKKIMRRANRTKKVKKKLLRTTSNGRPSWEWKVKNTVYKKVTTKKYTNNNEVFYKSREWRALRVLVLEKYKCSCMMCGRNPQEHSIVIHVDHIKPRSKFPELSLSLDNLQLLCEDCNLGKSNKFDTDWRPQHNTN